MKPLRKQKARIPADLLRVQVLAEQGLSPRQAARCIGMCYATFRSRINDEQSFRDAWERGCRKAGIQSSIKLSPFDSDDLPPLKPHDEIVLSALKRKKFKKARIAAEKRAAHVARITGFDIGTVVTSLERLVMHRKAEQIESLMYTLYRVEGEEGA